MKKDFFTLLWTAPSVFLSSFTIAVAAEAAQLFVSQAFALAILALLQTMPEFLVEGVIAWKADAVNMTANITGSIRLLTGFGIPLVVLVANLRGRGEAGGVRLEKAQVLPLIFSLIALFAFSSLILIKALNPLTGLPLFLLYPGYFILLLSLPPEGEESFGQMAEKLLSFRRARARILVFSFLLLGGTLLFLTVGPFLGSLKSLALRFGIPSYVFIQWIAPFLSEFPEGISAVYLARSRERAGMSIVNLLSSNIFQMTVIAGTIPLIASLSRGRFFTLHLNYIQQQELSLTVAQFVFVLTLMLRMEVKIWEALLLFTGWAVPFFLPSSRPLFVRYFGFLSLLELYLMVRKGELALITCLRRTMEGKNGGRCFN